MRSSSIAELNRWSDQDSVSSSNSSSSNCNNNCNCSYKCNCNRCKLKLVTHLPSHNLGARPHVRPRPVRLRAGLACFIFILSRRPDKGQVLLYQMQVLPHHINQRHLQRLPVTAVWKSMQM